MPEAVHTSSDTARAAAAEACRLIDLDPTHLALVRQGTNAVYRLVERGVIIRVAPLSARESDIERQVGVARWLEEGHAPAVRALKVSQPLEALNRLVTFWEGVNDASAADLDHYGSTAQLGHVLRQLHGMPEPKFPLPSLEPVMEAQSRLERLSHLTDEVRTLLSSRLQRVATAFADVRFELSNGPIHGDANVGNLLLDDAGQAVLADLDGFSIGPREWDLVLTAMFTDLYGWHTEDEYQAFIGSYGWDIRSWSGYHTLRDLRELLMVLWLAGKAENEADAAKELKIRLASFESGRGRENWLPL